MTLNKVLEELFNNTGVKLTEIGWELAEEQKQEAQSQIEKDLIQAMPDKKSMTAQEAMSHPEYCHCDKIQAGYNQALEDIKKLIKTYCRGESNE